MLLTRLRPISFFNVVLRFIIILMFFAATRADSVFQNVEKRLDIGVCIEKFDVHTNTLIQTSASLSMGAKFIADADLGSRNQCLRLCCETDNCDVFVYEEKLHGSCFLFECGPPSNFRCKFVNHANYTSAILDVSHPAIVSTTQTPPPPPTRPPMHPVLTEHELDLDKLRVKTARNKVEMVTSTTTAVPPLGVRIGDMQATKAPNCTRFQFQCKNKECIAIYDVCNGIPQCSDGSDEGPECPPTEIKQGASSDNYQKVQKPYSEEEKKLPDSSLIGKNREDPMTSPKIWPPHQNDNGYGMDTSSRIFNHKNGLQVPATNIQYPYQNSHDYMPLPADSYPAKQQGQPWVSQQRPNYNWLSQAPVNSQMQPNWGPLADSKPDIIKENEDLPAEVPPEESTSDEDEEIVTTEAPKKSKSRKHKKLRDKHHERHEHEDINEKIYQAQVSSLHSQLEFADHDGMSDRPSGAVLSLTLGVIITAALAIMIGCRMRVAGRRVRRHHPKGAGNHEADFLVNGMYL